MRVFVASATLDSAWVNELRTVLAECEEPSWLALPPIGPHPKWKLHARRAIESSNALLFVTTPRSAVSPHCAWELSTALELSKPCFQWVAEPVSEPHAAASLPIVSLGKAQDAPQWDFRVPNQPPTPTT